jgi:hypothetical protein
MVAAAALLCPPSDVVKVSRSDQDLSIEVFRFRYDESQLLNAQRVKQIVPREVAGEVRFQAEE